MSDLQSAHKKWINTCLQADERKRESHWTESIASGSKLFVEEVKRGLGFKVKGRSITGKKGRYQLKEDVAEFDNLSLNGPQPIEQSDAGEPNTIIWRDIS